MIKRMKLIIFNIVLMIIMIILTVSPAFRVKLFIAPAILGPPVHLLPEKGLVSTLAKTSLH